MAPPLRVWREGGAVTRRERWGGVRCRLPRMDEAIDGLCSLLPAQPAHGEHCA